MKDITFHIFHLTNCPTYVQYSYDVQYVCTIPEALTWNCLYNSPMTGGGGCEIHAKRVCQVNPKKWRFYNWFSKHVGRPYFKGTVSRDFLAWTVWMILTVFSSFCPRNGAAQSFVQSHWIISKTSLDCV